MLLAPFFRGLARHLQIACLALTVTTATVVAQTNLPSAADGFDPNIDGNVYAIARQESDGKLIVAGQFANVSPNGGITFPRNNIVRVNQDGSIDTDFNPDVNGPIRAVAMQGDGKIIIVGDFTTVSGEAHVGLARLTTSGAIDSSFKAGVVRVPATDTKPSLKPQVYAVILQTDGSIVIGGTFSGVQSTNGTTATRNNIARFSSTGALDTSYDPNPNGIVMALALHQDGKIVVGGNFTQFQENGKPAATARLRAARINRDGTLDSEFDPKPNDGVTCLAVQADGKIILGGYFTTLQPITDSSAMTRNHIGRLNADGTLDSEFYPTVAGNVLALCAAPDGSILVGGHFTQVYSRGTDVNTRAYVARLNNAGNLDDTFYAGVNYDVAAIAVQSDGKVVLGGYFTRAQPAGASTAITRNHIARVLPNGSLDASLQMDPGGRILTSVTLDDKSIIVGGSFTSIGGVTRNYLAKLKSDGSLDTTYDPNVNGPVYTLALSRDNSKKLLVGGSFTKIGPSTNVSNRNNIARLNADGTVDSEFNPSINGPIACIVPQKDGNILVGGSFNIVHPFGTTDDVTRNYLLRLTSAGQVDTAFNPDPNSTVTAIALESDEKAMIIVGAFSSVQPGATGQVHTRGNIARIMSDGSVDANYYPRASHPIYAAVMQSDNKVVIAGAFVAILPTKGLEWIERAHLARISPDGSVDTTFDPKPNDPVLTLAIQGDQILIGGSFTTFTPNSATNWTPARYFARLNKDGTVDTAFTNKLDLPQVRGQRVDSIAIQPSGDILLGGNFQMVQNGSARLARNRFARVSASGDVDTGFVPAATATTGAQIKAIALQTDGKFVVAGSFTDLAAATSTNIARFYPEGTPDNAFNAALSTDGTVNAVAVRANGVITPTQLGGFAWIESNGTLRTSFAPSNLNIKGHINDSVVQSDGKIILAGSFTDLANNASSNLVRLTPTGALDSSFAVTVDGTIYKMAMQSDGMLIIVGSFTSVNGTTRNRIARIDTKNGGALDGGFDPAPDSAVSSVVIQPDDGSIVIAGSFTNLYPNSTTTATARNYIARLTKAGAVDSTYNPNPNGAVNALAIESSGKIIAGGSFTTVQPNSDTALTTRNRIARFEKDGNVDKNFDPSANDVVNAIVVQPNQFILIGGAFTTLQPMLNGTSSPITSRSCLARVGSDGMVDASFSAGTNNVVTSLALDAKSGAITVGGYFNTVTPTGSTTAVARDHLARLTSTGNLDTTFNPDFAGTVTSVTLAADGSILVGGTFTSLQPTGLILLGGAFKTVGGVPVPYVAQLNGDGSINAGFQPSPDQAVNSVLALPDGKFLVGGMFTTIAGASRPGLARFNADSTLDTSFTPSGVTGGVNALARQADGKILVGTGSLAGLIRLNTDGSRDGSFTSSVPLVPATAIVVQPDGKIVVAGPGSGTPTKIRRLNTDGSSDDSFATVAFTGGTDVQSLTLQTDGSIIVSGSFSSIGGASIGKLARLKSNGTVDTTFNPAPNGDVTATALQSDGRLLIGGGFSTVGGLQRVGVARLASTSSSTQTLAVSSDGKTITWLRGGAGSQGGGAGELSGVTFEISTDGSTFTAADGVAGTGTRISTTSNWQITNLSVPRTGNVFVRARGIAPTVAGKSAGIYESVRMVNLSSPVQSVALAVTPVVSAVAWDQTHYVWTVDSAGVLRIADSLSGFVVAGGQTVLINGGSVAGSSAGTRLADLATRGTVNPSSPLISGFAVTGTSARSVLVRAVGPTLASFGVTDALSKPQLVLYNSTGGVIGSNSGWNSDAALSAVFARTGAFPLNQGSADAALVATLAPGTYSVQVVDGGSNSTGGSALVEIYDAGSLSDGTSRLVNLSSRGTVPANSSLIGGLVISGSAPKTMLVRGVGPTLARYGVSNVLADPKIGVYDALGNLIASNDNWSTRDDGTTDVSYFSAISSAVAAAGAFGYDSGSKDAALVITLPAGAYTVQVSGVNGASGAALIEVYELP